MPPGPRTTTIPNVPIVRTGTWFASTGVTTITEEDLVDAVRAQADVEIDEAPIKPGHTSPLAKLLESAGDAAPALGWIENLKIEDHEKGGKVLVGDIVNIPIALAAVIPLAFKRRSAELAWGVTTPGGQRYRMVLTALSLLGKFNPAVKGLGPIESLGDVYKLFGMEPDEGAPPEGAPKAPATLTADRVGALMFDDGIGDPARLAVAQAKLAAIDDRVVRDAWRKANPPKDDELESSWVSKVVFETGTAGGFVIVEPAMSAGADPDELDQVPWTADDEGDITFGTAKRVKVTYTPVETKARAAILAGVRTSEIELEVARTMLSAIGSVENPPGSANPGDNDPQQQPHPPQEAQVMPVDEKRIKELLESEDEAEATKGFLALRADHKKGEAKPEGEAKPDGKPDEGTEGKPDGKPADEKVPAGAGASSELADALANLPEPVKTALTQGADAHKQLQEAKVATALREAAKKIGPVPEEQAKWKVALERDYDGTMTLLSSLPDRFPTSEVGDDSALAAAPDDAAWDQWERETFGDAIVVETT